MNWREYQRLQKVCPLDDHFLSYVDEGKGAPLVLIHGIPTWGYLWHELLKPLSKDFRVLIPDLMGFGFSDKADNFDRSIAAQTEYLVKWLQQLGIKKVYLAAQDIGGGVALRMAVLYPDLVQGLCVMNTIAYDSWPIEMMIQLGHPLVYKKVSAPTLVSTLKFALKSGFASKPSAEFLDGLLAPYETEVGKLSLIRNAAALNTNLTTEITAKLSGLSIPTKILWGVDDKFQLLKYGRRLSNDIPDATLLEIRKARHFVMVDQAETVTEALSEFFKVPMTIPRKRSKRQQANADLELR